jgi:ribulose 1,5-bisphosphate carboxylase large subunit-like protein
MPWRWRLMQVNPELQCNGVDLHHHTLTPQAADLSNPNTISQLNLQKMPKMIGAMILQEHTIAGDPIAFLQKN